MFTSRARAYVARMPTAGVRPFGPRECETLRAWLGSPLRRLTRLRDRVTRTGVNAADPELFAAVVKARNAVYDLVILLQHRATRSPDGYLLVTDATPAAGLPAAGPAAAEVEEDQRVVALAEQRHDGAEAGIAQ
jgi:hypothetical protein